MLWKNMRGFLHVLNVTLISPQGTLNSLKLHPMEVVEQVGRWGRGMPRESAYRMQELCIRSKRTHMTPSRLVGPEQTYHAEPDKLHDCPRSWTLYSTVLQTLAGKARERFLEDMTTHIYITHFIFGAIWQTMFCDWAWLLCRRASRPDGELSGDCGWSHQDCGHLGALRGVGRWREEHACYVEAKAHGFCNDNLLVLRSFGSFESSSFLFVTLDRAGILTEGWGCLSETLLSKIGSAAQEISYLDLLRF